MATATKRTVAFPAGEHEVQPVVLVTSDVDCDGTGYGYHRVLVPLALANSGAGARWFAVQTEQMSGYGDVCELMTERQFREKVWPEMTEFDQGYWEEVGYHGVFHSRYH